MSYRLTLSKEIKDEKDYSGFCYHQTIKVKPSLTDVQIKEIEPMTGKSDGCDRFGSEVREVSPSQIKIATYCHACKDVLIGKIANLLGKEITKTIIQVD